MFFDSINLTSIAMKTSFTKYYILIGFLLLQNLLSWSAVPSGYYYFVNNKSKAELKTALHRYCSPLYVLDYGSGPGFTWEGFYSTDKKSDNSVVDMYSNTIRYFNGYNSISGMHIEHSFPKSWWGSHVNNAYRDLFHLYPSDGVANSTKNNFPLGEISGVAPFDNGVSKIGKNSFGGVYSENCFEPADEFKGDFARSYLYIATVYENLASFWSSPMLQNNTYPVWTPWAKELLLKWHHQDPVSEKELTRIESVYNIQGNRNPFIDFPQLADYIWGNDTAKVFSFPVETESFLVTPRRGEKINFGVILKNDSRNYSLNIKGVNINSPLSIRIKNSTAAFTLSTNTITASDALNGLNLQLQFLPVNAGSYRDTLIIENGGLTQYLQIPLKALATDDFMALEPTEITPVGGTLNWMTDTKASDYQLSVYQGDSQAGDLIISAYVEGTSYNKAIELYNGTGKTIDLSKYSLQKQANGAGNFGSTISLTGTLANNETYVIANNNYLVKAELKAKAQLLDSLIVNFNGNDAVQLLRNGVEIDRVGEANAGAEVLWGLDLTLKRKSTVTHPTLNFKMDEWQTSGIDNFDVLGSHSMQFSTPNYIIQNQSTGNVSSFTTSQLQPNQTYTYQVSAQRSGGLTPAVNTMQIHTGSLDAPVAMNALNVNSTGFRANWEESLYASDYLLDFFTQSGQEETIENEGFDGVGTNGKPLPTSWTGTASGNYTTATSSGVAVPSVALKNNTEWLQTKTYPENVSKFTFMYRFASAATGSSLIVDGYSNDRWIRIDSISYKNTSKAYPAYNFTKSQKMNAFRFTYNKLTGSGNLSIDDVQATYGGFISNYLQKDIKVLGTQYDFTNLINNTEYFYQVRAVLGSAISDYSDIIKVKTTYNTGINFTNNSNLKISKVPNQILISGLQANETVLLYNITGACISQQKTSSDKIIIPVYSKGVYVIVVRNEKYKFTAKIIE